MPKKRGAGEGGLYQLKGRGLWRGVIDVGYGPDGRRKQKSVTAKTQAAARAKLDALKVEMKQYGAPLDNARTVESWATHWLDTVCRNNLKPRALASYQSVVRVWIIPTIGKKRISLLKPSDVRAVMQAAIDANRGPATAEKIHTVLSSMLESARLDGLIGRNIVGDVKAPSTGESSRGSFSTEDALRILEAAASLVDGTRWWAALLAGMRQGERLGATLDSLDFNNHRFTVQWSLTEATFEHGCGGTCTVKRAGSCPQRRLMIKPGLRHKQLDGRLVLVPPKSGKPRTFPMLPQLEQAMKRYLEATADVPNPHGLIWRNSDGSPITAGQDQAAWRDLLLTAGVITAEQAKPLGERETGTPSTPTTHWSRHTTATVLMELGVDARIVGEIVGHASTRVTHGYQHVSSEAARAAMTALGSHYAKALGAPMSEVESMFD
ncbi:tyrosine-type recombinase/integrase [Microbacterium sp. H37-C3]|uniref:tyrosine-type recombinase/integrase n=1 Tax=Microbacterium sp. H37-C3 TaxID=3004354 RepID=UPI0022AF1FB5|nr:tyrosine-type recombinase/integrase [Microbacterium sp. H37-C3]MCZ4069256.1 tyrosine-type recombinase/integrase [Microbacterium sp. H37-C3]